MTNLDFNIPVYNIVNESQISDGIELVIKFAHIWFLLLFLSIWVIFFPPAADQFTKSDVEAC